MKILINDVPSLKLFMSDWAYKEFELIQLHYAIKATFDILIDQINGEDPFIEGNDLSARYIAEAADAYFELNCDELEKVILAHYSIELANIKRLVVGSDDKIAPNWSYLTYSY